MTKVINTMGVGNCGGRCFLQVHVNGNRIEKITTESKKAAEAADIVPLCACTKGLHAHHTFLDCGYEMLQPDVLAKGARLRYPMKRIGQRGEGKFQRISWEEAIDTIAGEWIRIRDTYGPGSRYVSYATGIEGVMRGDAMIRRLMNLDGGSLEHYNNYSTGCIGPTTRMMYGTIYSGNDPSDWLNSSLIILWGHNPEATRFDITMYYLQKAREKGIPIIVIDPRRSDTVRSLSAEWIPIRPATDAALQDAMAYVIIEHGLQDQKFLDQCCVGFDDEHLPEGISAGESYRAYLTGQKDGVKKTPEWAEMITGVPAETIRSLAVRYATAKPAALIQGYGAQRHHSGEQGVRGAITLACMSGNIGISGGWASGTANVPGHQVPEFPEGTNPYGRKIPVYLWTSAVDRGTLLTEMDGLRGNRLMSNIKMIFSLASNILINQHGDINRTAELLRDPSGCEFIVCSDLFMTASAKFADILLPGVSVFEMENITTAWKYGDFLGFSNQIVDPLYEGKQEYEWILALAEKLGYKEAFSLGRTAGEWLKAIYEDLRKVEPELPEYEQFKKDAIYRYRKQPLRIAFQKEVQCPEQFPFPTPSGRIEVFSETVYRSEYPGQVPAIPCYVPPVEGPQDPLTEKYPLQLIGWHTKRRTHSVHEHNPVLRKMEPQQLWIHPEDARVRGLQDGDSVCVWNDRGKMKTTIKVTDDIMQGVTAMAQGGWYEPDADGTDVGGCINVLTSQESTCYAKGNPQHSNLVQVSKIC